MSNDEFDVLDELYFVQSFSSLMSDSGLKESLLVVVLEGLFSKGWIKILENHDDEVSVNELDLNKNYFKYHYLASKAGLLAHNGR